MIKIILLFLYAFYIMWGNKMNKIYNLLIKSIKHIETESNKYKKKEEDISSKRLLKYILFDLH